MISKIHILGGTHGNERMGVHLVQFLMQQSLPLVQTQSNLSIVPIFANVEAIKRNSRYINCDLNRQFGLSQTPSLYEHYRSQELAKQLKNTDFLIDIHSTTSNMGISIIVL